MPKPITEMTLEELRAAENKAWAALKEARKAAEPAEEFWNQINDALQVATQREKVLSEIRANWKGPGACPV